MIPAYQVGQAGLVGPHGDPYWGNVILLLNGSDTPTTDSSSFNRSLTNTGSVILDSGNQLFGVDTYRIQTGFDNRIEHTADSFIATAFGAEEFCIDIHAYVTGVGIDNRFCLYKNFIFRWLSSGNFEVTCTSIGGGSVGVAQSDNGAAADTWHHVRLVRDNTSDATYTVLRLFVNGIEKSSVGSIAKSSVLGSGNEFGRFIGVSGNDAYGHFTNKRMTAGAARTYTDFTPPSAPYPTS